MNKVALCGNLGREWDITNHEFGLVAKNVLAVSSNFKKDKEQKTDWIPIVCFAGKADVITKYTQKGDKILISDGNISVSSYTDETGNQRTSFNVVINDFEFLPNKRSDNTSLANQAQTMQNYANNNKDQFVTQDYNQTANNEKTELTQQVTYENVNSNMLSEPTEQPLFNSNDSQKANNAF